MVKIYLDKNDIVRVDTTPDGRLARDADANRGLLKMAGLLERLALLTARINRERGRSTTVQVAALNEIDRLRDEILIRTPPAV